MKSKVIAFFLSIKKTWMHLVITLIFGVIILFINYITELSPNIFNLLIGILSGLIASFLLAHCEVYRINISAKNKIQNTITIFCDSVTNSKKSSKYNLSGMYKLYIDLLSNLPDLTFKSNFEAISKNVASIIFDINNNIFDNIKDKLKTLQDLSESFYK